MKIHTITQTKFNNNHTYHIQNSAKENGNISQSGVYNPIYYKDYNVKINFGKRSPEDFYAQDFNKNNMPSTMKTYLEADFTQRSKIAPVQIMQEAYDDLNYALTVDDIKEYYPQEEKFSKLKPANYETATHGILRKIKDIKSMQETPEPLFKDGCDDLTTYLVKKIYLEGKTVKEIDKDFAKDINDVYELAAKVPTETAKNLGKNESAYFSHSTIYRLGIRFPEVPFWNSFISTRDDYDRVKRIKTHDGRFINADSPEGKAILKAREAVKTQAKIAALPKYNIQTDRANKISKTVIDSHKGGKRALKEIQHHSRDKEELSFIQKYWSEIMSVATEKIHLSEELLDFNAERKTEDQKLGKDVLNKIIEGEDLTKREQTPLKIFWAERPDLKGHFSTAISDTIVLFSNTFGPDGNNTEFKELIQYAQDIKPTREAQKLEHLRIQAEYDEIAKELNTLETKETIKEAIKTAPEKTKAPLQTAYKYIINGEEIITDYEINSCGREIFHKVFDLFPKQAYSTYLKELEQVVDGRREQFWLSTQTDPDDDFVPDKIKRVLMPTEELNEIHKSVAEIMEEKHNPLLEKTRLALEIFAIDNNIIPADKMYKYGAVDIIQINDEIKKVLGEDDSSIQKAQNEIQKIYNQYNQPLSNKERVKIKIDLFQNLKKYTGNKSVYQGTVMTPLIELLANSAKSPDSSEIFKKVFTKNETMIDDEGPVLRYLLDPKGNEQIKNIMREHVYNLFIGTDTEQVALHITKDKKLFDQMLAEYPQEKQWFKEMAHRAMNKVIKFRF